MRLRNKQINILFWYPNPRPRWSSGWWRFSINVDDPVFNKFVITFKVI